MNICNGGWKVTYYEDFDCVSVISDPNQVVPSINKVSGSENGHEKMPENTRSSKWITNLCVNESDQYEFITRQSFSENTPATPGTMQISIVDLETGDMLSEVSLNTFELTKNKIYEITATWTADSSATSNSINALNLSFSWRRKSNPDAEATLVGPQNTIFSLSCGLERIVKSAYIIKCCAMTLDQLNYCADNQSELGIIDFNDLPDRDKPGIVPWTDLSVLFEIFILDKEISFRRSTTTLFGLNR